MTPFFPIKKNVLLALLVVYAIPLWSQQMAQPDLSNATVLCDKDPVSIDELNGCGSDCNEAVNTCLEGQEVNTTWFTWIGNNFGDVTFTITPDNANDVFSFVVYQFNSGLDNPDDRTQISCMRPCGTGPVGVAFGNTLANVQDCSLTDGFLRPFSVQEGKVFALMINNSTSTGGFTIEFGGDAEFLGPQPDITPDVSVTCYGNSVTFTNSSTFTAGDITSYNWEFGSDATPETRATDSPDAQTVSYGTAGAKSVTLTLSTSLGCTTSRTFTDIVTIDDCCDSDNQVTITDTTITQIACPGDTNGAIDLTMAASNFPPVFSWSNGESTEDISMLPPDTYSVTATNEAGCSDSLEYTFVPPNNLSATDTIINPSCGGVEDGTITINATGGRPPYTYDFGDGNGPVMTNSLTGLAIGDYEVTVYDDSGCDVKVEGIELAEKELELTLQGLTDPLCTGSSNGSVSIDVLNGVAPYTFDFNDGSPRRTADEMSMIAAGVYNIEVYDNEGCRGGPVDVTLTDPAPLNVSISNGPVSCNGGSDGGAIATASGGTPPYSFSWSNGTTGANLSDVSAGSYMLTLRDANNCEIQRTATVTEPATPLTANILTTTNISCPGGEDGSIEWQASGGTSPYQYSMDGTVFEDGNIIDDLEAGNYTITIADSRNCQVMLDTTLSDQANLQITIQETSDICYGETFTFEDASTFNVGIPTGYTWDFGQGANPASATGPGPHSVRYNTLGNPTVSLTIDTDQNNCQVSFDTTLSWNIIPCCESVNRINITGSVADPLCFNDQNGSINIAPASQAPITGIVWDNATGNVSLDNLAAGTYTVSVTNDATCEKDSTFTLINPSPVSARLSLTPPSCGGGTDGIIEVFANGGTGTYEYDFGSGFGIDNQNNSLSVGDYTIRVRDQNNCPFSTDTVLNELVLQISQSQVSPVSCFGRSDGTINFGLSNGTPPYTFDLGNGFEDPTALQNLPAGDYTVRIQDSDFCLSEPTTVTINQPDTLVVTLQATNISCFGEADGQLQAIVTGGNQGNSFLWSNGQNGISINGLTADTYSVMVTDQRGCTDNAAATIEEPEQLFAFVESAQDASCFNATDGQIVAGASGGSSPYYYSLDGIIFQETADLTGLAAGDYEITVRDDRNCEAFTQESIAQPEEFTITATSNKEVAGLGESVTLTANADQGIADLSYIWSIADSVVCDGCDIFETIPPGSATYTVTGINSDNCAATTSIAVNVTLDRPVYFPNIFTPDGDGLHDRFFIPFSSSMKAIKEIKIYDRYGGLLYEEYDIGRGEGVARGWDGSSGGQRISNGVYIVDVTIVFVDDLSVRYHKDVTLIR